MWGWVSEFYDIVGSGFKIFIFLKEQYGSGFREIGNFKEQAWYRSLKCLLGAGVRWGWGLDAFEGGYTILGP